MRELGKGPRAHKHLRLSGAKKSRVFFVFPNVHESMFFATSSGWAKVCAEHSVEGEDLFLFKLLGVS